jgi:hypothetical protein
MEAAMAAITMFREMVLYILPQILKPQLFGIVVEIYRVMEVILSIEFVQIIIPLVSNVALPQILQLNN